MVEFFSEGPLLAIETSCDETSAAILEGSKILCNVVYSQVDLHRQWGGVVPEAAARAHVDAIVPVLSEAFQQSGIDKSKIKAIAVTNRPGLVGALSVGVTAAKALSLSLNIPILGVHHLEGHLMSPYSLGDLVYPHVALVVSGGHTELVHVRAFGDYEILGETRDDAAGEAFDKASRLLGLGYPGGIAIQKAAEGHTPKYNLPKGLSGQTMEFSFSGLKTAVHRLVEAEGDNLDVGAMAASVQEVIAGVLAERALFAAESLGVEAVSLVGGVAANKRLRELLEQGTEKLGIRLLVPPISLCTDNAAMIGLAGSIRLARGERSGMDLGVYSSSPLPGLEE